MGRAFKKESDAEAIEDVVIEPRDPLPPGVPNYITPEGAARLRADLDGLQAEREALIGALPEDAGPGEKQPLRKLDARIRYLAERIAGLEIVDPSEAEPGRVHFGSAVTVADEAGREQTWRIVGVDESDPDRGRISWISPLARALRSREAGDEVTVDLPGGRKVLEILKVEYR